MTDAMPIMRRTKLWTRRRMAADRLSSGRAGLEGSAWRSARLAGRTGAGAVAAVKASTSRPPVGLPKKARSYSPPGPTRQRGEPS